MPELVLAQGRNTTVPPPLNPVMPEPTRDPLDFLLLQQLEELRSELGMIGTRLGLSLAPSEPVEPPPADASTFSVGTGLWVRVAAVVLAAVFIASGLIPVG